MPLKEKALTIARKKIEKEIEQVEEERQRKLKNQRLELARMGMTAYKSNNIKAAVRAFEGYLRTWEDMYGVQRGGLTPRFFDPKKDLIELLMISGVYWDLAKIYDRSRTAQKRKDLLLYLDKYILFSKGMPFQALCAETMRKYIVRGKPLHRGDFKNAYRVLNPNQCFIATALVDVTFEFTIPVLRDFRDDCLKNSNLGQCFIRGYYHCGPSLAEHIDRLPYFLRRMMGLVLSGFAFLIQFLMNHGRNSTRSKKKLTFREIKP
jgi:hypothetical protein